MERNARAKLSSIRGLTCVCATRSSALFHGSSRSPRWRPFAIQLAHRGIQRNWSCRSVGGDQPVPCGMRTALRSASNTRVANQYSGSSQAASYRAGAAPPLRHAASLKGRDARTSALRWPATVACGRPSTRQCRRFQLNIRAAIALQPGDQRGVRHAASVSPHVEAAIRHRPETPASLARRSASR